MDQQQDLLYEQKQQQQNGKLKMQHLDEGQKVMEENHQDKGRLMSHVAVQTEQEQSAGWKGPCVTVQVQQQLRERGKASCVTVTVQQQCGSRGEVPEVSVQVERQEPKPGQSCVIVQLQHEWEKVEEVSSVSVKVQQKSIGSGLSGPHVIVQVQQKSQEAEVPSENVHLLNADRYEEVPLVRKDQQARYKEGLLAAEEEHQQQDRERTGVIDSEPLKQDAKVSVVKKCLLLQDRWDHSTEELKQVQVLQTDQEENRVEKKMTEKQLYDVRQTAEGTKTFSLQPWSVNEDALKEATAEQQKELQKDSNAIDQLWASSDEAVSETVAEKQKVYGHKKQIVPKRLIRDAPNYFVAIPVTNDKILDKIEDVQELIFTKQPDLLRARIPVQAMHLTIIVAHLRTEDDVKRAVSALKKSKAKVEGLLQGKCFIMTFRGIGQFNNQVTYIKMLNEDQQMLSKIAETVESSFNEFNIDITGSKDFKPHLTFLKLSKVPALRRKGFRKISADLYKDYEDSLFGTEVFRQIDLCAMHKKKQDSGYYYCECSIDICPVSSENQKELQTDDLKENVIGVPLNDGADDSIGATPL